MLRNQILILEKDIELVNETKSQLLPFGYADTHFTHIHSLEQLDNAAVRTFSPDVIFANIDDLDANEVLKKYKDIQQIFPRIPVIVFSTVDEDELAIKCIQAGAQSFLSKGKFTPSQLYRLIAFSRERNELNQELSRLKADYQTIFEKNGLPMLVADVQTRQIISVNEAAIRLYKYPKNEFCNLQLEQLNDSTTALDVSFDDDFMGKDYKHHFDKDGELVYVEMMESTITYNKIAALLITINNVTDKVLAASEERKAKQRLDAIFNGTKDIILLANDSGKCVQVNKSAYGILGYSEADIMNMQVGDLVNIEQENEENVWDFFLQPANQTGIIKLKKKNGEIIICTHNVTKHLLPGLHLWILTDVTMLEKNKEKIKEQSNRIENILNSISDCFFTVDKNDIITYWNSAAERLIGIKRENLIGKNLWDSFENLKQFQFYINYQKVVQEKVTAHFEEYYTAFDIWVRSSAYPTSEGVAIFFTDITATKKHSLEMQEARNNQAALINSSKHLIWSIDAGMKILSYNEAYAKRIEEITGKAITDGMQLPAKFHNPEKEKQWKEYYRRALNGEAYTAEETIEDIYTGKKKRAEINFNPIYGVNTDKIIGVACYSHDITHKEEARHTIEGQNELLKENKLDLERLATKLEKVMNSSMDVICSLDEKGNFLQVSKASFFIWGYEPEELIGKSNLDFVAPQFIQPTLQASKNIVKGAVYTDFQNNFIHKDGHQVSLVWSARWDKEEQIMFCVARDATNMKETERIKDEQEQRISALVQNGADIVGILDKEANYMYISPNIKTLLGYDPETLLGTNALDLIHAADVANALASLKKVLVDGQVKLAAFRHKNAYGEWRWIETVASNQLHNPAIKGIVISSRDITSRKQIEAERELMIKELLKSNADLKQFSFITSHNLRAPLSNLNGILNILEFDKLDEYNQNLIGMLGKSVKQLGQTIDDLSKILIIKNNVNIEVLNIDLHESFHHVKDVFLNTLNDLCADVETDFQVTNIPFNPTYFESILVNLISNAIKYRSVNRSLAISISSEYDSKGNIVFKFGDNGIGIDIPRHKNKLFGLYQRFHDHIEGHGLGLFIIKSQIVALGGKIEIQSEVDQGTTFIITLKVNGSDKKKVLNNNSSMAVLHG